MKFTYTFFFLILIPVVFAGAGISPSEIEIKTEEFAQLIIHNSYNETADYQIISDLVSTKKGEIKGRESKKILVQGKKEGEEIARVILDYQSISHSLDLQIKVSKKNKNQGLLSFLITITIGLATFLIIKKFNKKEKT